MSPRRTRRMAGRDAAARLPLAAVGVMTAALAAPWAFGLARPAAVAGHVAFAMAIGPIALLSGVLPAAAYATGVAGAWLAVSPWVLGYASAGVAAWAVDLAAGLLLVAMARLAVRDGR